MTRDEAKQIWPIMQAYAEGKEAQYKDKEGVWRTNFGANFNAGWEYRIRPDPREFWLVAQTGVPAMPFSVFGAKPHGFEGREIIHVREVL